MSFWRRGLDRERIRRRSSLDIGVAGAWATIHDLEPGQRKRSFAFAAEALARYEGLIDKPMMTGDVIWRFAYISDANTLQRDYSANLTGSRHFEMIGDVAMWIVPTLIQFCFAAEILRRQMWSLDGIEQSKLTGRVASDRVGLLALGKT